MDGIILFLKSTFGQIVVGAVVVVLVLFLVFKWGEMEGTAKWKGQYDSLVDTTKKDKELQKDAWDRELKRQAAESKDIQDGLSKQLLEAQNRQLPVKEVIKEVTKYVTQKADAACPVPAGFQWVFNSSIGLPTATGMAASKPGDVDAPSGITLSGISIVTSENNLECNARGEVIAAWQQWYLKYQGIFARMQLVVPQP
jgi:hypothetical protein